MALEFGFTDLYGNEVEILLMEHFGKQTPV
jgi:hypothetical protein